MIKGRFQNYVSAIQNKTKDKMKKYLLHGMEPGNNVKYQRSNVFFSLVKKFEQGIL